MNDAPARNSDDLARLIQETLSELGYAADAKAIAERVVGLNRGLPAEDEFSVICSWLGRTTLIHKLDQVQAPASSRATYQVPDLFANFKDAGPCLVEVKVSKDQTISFRPDYMGKIKAYADLIGRPLLIAWKYNSIWMLFEARHMRLANVNFNISLSEALRQNLLGVLVGDVAFGISEKSGVHFECAKEELLHTEKRDDDSGISFSEQWRMRISDVYFTDREGQRRNDLHPETQQIFTGLELESDEEHFPDRIKLSFRPREDQMQFAHTALVHLLNWERSGEQPQNWRHLLHAPTVIRSIENFGHALERALSEKVVRLILHQQPVDWPEFLPRRP